MSVTSPFYRVTEALQAFSAWARDVVRDDAPATIAGMGRRPVARLAALGASGGLQPQGLVYTSWLGHDTVESAPDPGSRPAPLRVVLDGDHVFTRTVSVNMAIARRDKATLRARLARHCPIPLNEAVIEAEVRRSDGAERVLVDMVVARRSTVIQASKLAVSEASEWSVVGRTGDGRFIALSNPQRRGREMLGAAGFLGVLVCSSLLFAGASWTDRLSREADALEDRRAELLSQARMLRDENSERDRLERLEPVTDSYTTLPLLLSAIAEIDEYPEVTAGIWRMEYRLPETLYVQPADERQAALMIPLSSQDVAEGTQ